MTRKPLVERLRSRTVRVESGCLEFQGARDRKGYGVIARGGHGEGVYKTHRAAWELAHGPIPPGMSVCHRCDNPPCCNPEHLFLGTHADNMADKVAKGRDPRKYSAEQIRHMRDLLAIGLPDARIAAAFGCTNKFVYCVRSGRRAA